MKTPPSARDLAPLLAALRARDAIGALFESQRLPRPWRDGCRGPLPAWDEQRHEQPHPGLYALAQYCSHRSYQGDATQPEIKAWRRLHDECLAVIAAPEKSPGPRPVPVYPAAAVNLRNAYDAAKVGLKALKKLKAPKAPTPGEVADVITRCCDGLHPSTENLELILLDLKGKTPAFVELGEALGARAGMKPTVFRDKVALKKLPKAALP